MTSDKINEAGDSQIVLYQPNESVKLEVKVDAGHGTVWLTQQQIADLFGTKRPAITKHLNNIFKSGELEQNSVSSILEHTASDGKVYKTRFYNLDAIISVGYRVNSVNATAFRKWKKESHDRWLIIDDSLYHCGHSLNANGGHKISAITLMGTSPEAILAEME